MLGHLRVIDLTDHGAMIAGQILGDLGAEVILVEPPGGAELRKHGPFWHDEPNPERSLTFWSFNRNKKSVTLDLETDAGRARLRELASGADIIFESFAPGYLGARGLGYQQLSAANPALVMASITALGQDGPKAGWAATDITAWASSRAMMMTGDSDRAPLALSVPQAFLHAGAEAAAGALIAYHARLRDGLGQHVDVSAQAAAAMATQATILEAAWNSPETLRVAGGVNFGGIPLKFVNPAKDGYVSVTFLFGTALGPFSRRLMEVLCEEGFVDEATRDKDWIGYTMLIASGQEPLSEYVRCAEAIGRWTAQHTKADLLKLGMEKGLLIVPVSTASDVLHSPQLAARDFWEDVAYEQVGASVRVPGAFAKFAKTPLAAPKRAPMLGEHTGSVAPRTVSAAITGGGGGAALAGVKVLDIMWVLAGPWAIRTLADYGATVVRLESASRIDTARTIGPFKDGAPGPERTAAWSNTNAGKLGLTLSLTNPASRATLEKLVRWADVITESFTPGTMARLGLGYDDLARINPGVILVSSCLNGQTGPYAQLAGFGTMGAQIAGFGHMAGWPDRPPAGPAGAYTDYVAPKFTVAAIMAALEHRRLTGEGQHIDFSQAEASAHFIAPALIDCAAHGRNWEHRGNASTVYAPHGVYRAAGDDRWAAIAVVAESQWPALCGAIGATALANDPALASAEGRIAQSARIDEAISAWTATRDVEEIERVLQAAGVPCHRASSAADAVADPQLNHRGHFVTVPHPEHGSVVIEGSRMRFSRTPAQVTRPGPTMGEHNFEVLETILGLTPDEIGELAAAGALE